MAVNEAELRRDGLRDAAAGRHRGGRRGNAAGLFDLDVAIGAQLDATGQWIGPSRNVSLPILGTDFTWSDPSRGWMQGLWKGPYSQQYGITQLDDDTYRRLLNAVVMSNHWDGTIPGMQAIFDTFFVDPATLVFVQDQGQVPLSADHFRLGDKRARWTQAAWAGRYGPRRQDRQRGRVHLHRDRRQDPPAHIPRSSRQNAFD